MIPAIAAPGRRRRRSRRVELVASGHHREGVVHRSDSLARRQDDRLARFSKHSGDVVLNRLAELLAKEYPSTDRQDHEPTKAGAISDGRRIERIAEAVASVPDLVIASMRLRQLPHGW
ncbi:MAG: hypothetical protein ACLR0N_06460 [Bilophila wadsworthia]